MIQILLKERKTYFYNKHKNLYFPLPFWSFAWLLQFWQHYTNFRICLIFKGAQAWAFFPRVFCTERTHLGRGLGNKTKKFFFLHLTPDFDRFWFFAAYWVCGKSKKKFLVRPKLKVDCCCIGAHMCTYNGFFLKFYSYGTLMNVYKF